MIIWHICSLVLDENNHEAEQWISQIFSILYGSYQLVLIADPYSDHKFLEKNDSAAKEEMFEM